MKKVNITEAKTNLSALIDGLKGGSSVLIVDRGRPVARLEPVTGDPEGGGQDGKLSRLLRDGLVRPRRGRPPRALFDSPPPRARAGASAVDAPIEGHPGGRGYSRARRWSGPTGFLLTRRARKVLR